jgi:hypothetical protein
MIKETSFTIIDSYNIKLLKNEAIDRLESVVRDLPKYKEHFDELIVNFSVENMQQLIKIIYEDTDFKSSKYYCLYNMYFYEIENLIKSFDSIHKEF